MACTNTRSSLLYTNTTALRAALAVEARARRVPERARLLASKPPPMARDDRRRAGDALAHHTDAHSQSSARPDARAFFKAE